MEHNHKKGLGLIDAFLFILVLLPSARATPCDDCRTYCEEQQKKNNMQNLVLCDNQGVTWHNNCDFMHRQCEALAEGKFLWITGEGDCSRPIDDVGNLSALPSMAIGHIGKVDNINTKLDKIDAIEKTNNKMENIGNVDAIELHVTVPTLDKITADTVDAVDDVVDVDVVPTIPNKRPIIPTPKKPESPKKLDKFPATLPPSSEEMEKDAEENEAEMNKLPNNKRKQQRQQQQQHRWLKFDRTH